MKPKVHHNKKLVLILWKSTNMFKVYKINNLGKVNKKFTPLFSSKKDINEAGKEMNIPITAFKSVKKFDYNSCTSEDDLVQTAWEKRND
ncbi:hypothetical protein COB55_03530 [Candidatus Wolfebacteria bacterium]|nr:MAG: hypothetical protein COB55_03530 [Candidatus Wolfebacteria bacterium]